MSTINILSENLVGASNMGNNYRSLEENTSNFNVLFSGESVASKVQLLEVALQNFSKEGYLTSTGVSRVRAPFSQVFVLGEMGESNNVGGLGSLYYLLDDISSSFKEKFFRYLDSFTNGDISSSVIRGLSSLLLEGD